MLNYCYINRYKPRTNLVGIYFKPFLTVSGLVFCLLNKRWTTYFEIWLNHGNTFIHYAAHSNETGFSCMNNKRLSIPCFHRYEPDRGVLQADYYTRWYTYSTELKLKIEMIFYNFSFYYYRVRSRLHTTSAFPLRVVTSTDESESDDGMFHTLRYCNHYLSPKA